MKNTTKNANRWSSETTSKPVTKDDVITTEGIVIDALPNAMFRVRLNTNQEILCTLAGKLKQNRIRVLVDDHVSVDISPYDLTKGRITWRR